MFQLTVLLLFVSFFLMVDTIYQNTRNFILSEYNPYYFKGSKAEGVGSPHTKPGYVRIVST